MKDTQKIGILGGTFDPPHWGHVLLANHFSKVFQLDQLIWIPTGDPWQKSPLITPAKIRFQLTKAASEDLKGLLEQHRATTKVQVDDTEIERNGPSYTIDTAKILRERHGPEASIIWLMGADSFLNLPTWHDWRDLLHFINLAVANRPQHILDIDGASPIGKLMLQKQTTDAKKLGETPSGLIYFDKSLSIDLSSTQLRRNFLQTTTLNEAKSTNEGIPPKVFELIKNLGIYK